MPQSREERLRKKRIQSCEYRRKNKKRLNRAARQVYADHLESQRKRGREKHQRNRDIVLNHYGHQCECCHEARREFLAIDHRYGGGTAHRREVGRGNSIYLWIIKHGFPVSFRLLCHNCNMAWAAYGYCPHQTEHQ